MGRQVAKSCLPTTITNEGKRWRGLLPGFVLFRLVAPPPQSGVVGPYLAQGVWFPSHLLLEGTGHI
jgi:membrane-associated phospholipid phosphatase